MASTLKVENFFDTVIASTFVNSSGDVSVQLWQAPTNTKGFIIFSPDNANLREIAYYDSTSGTTINIKGINRINPKEHSQWETARINDVAELFNYFSGNTSHAFYIEKLSSTLINVFGGNVMINGTTYSLNDTQFSLPLDGTYYIGLNINSGLIEMQPTIVSYIIPRATVVKVWSSLTITYSKYDMTVMYGVFDWVIPPALVASINDKLDKVSGLRTSMTPKAFMVTDASGNEWTITGTAGQVVGFDGSSNPIAMNISSSTLSNSYTAWETIAAWNAVYMNTDWLVYLAGTATTFLWFAKSTVTTGQSVVVDINGISTTQTSLSVGSRYYLTTSENVWNRWNTNVAMTTARAQCASSTVNNKIYIIGWFDWANALQTNEEYNPATNTWATKAVMTTARRLLRAAPIGTKIYCIGWSATSFNYLQTNEEYDTVANTWATKAVMTTARQEIAIWIWTTKLYAIGGLITGAVATPIVEEYDTVSNTWTSKASMTTARYNAWFDTVNGITYVIGWNTGSVTAVNEAYDIAGNSWATKTSMTTAREWLFSRAINWVIYNISWNSWATYYSNNEAYDIAGNSWSTKAVLQSIWKTRGWVWIFWNSIYCIGWHDWSSYLNTNQSYDTTTNLWNLLSAMTTARYTFTASTVNSKIYCIGGTINWSQYLQTNEEYNPATNTWTTKANMTTWRQWCSSAAVNNKIYVIWWFSTWPVVSNINEEYDPTANTWASKTNMTTARLALTCSVVNNKIYAIGWSNWSILQTNEEYDPTANTWASKTNMTTARQELLSQSFNNKIYCIGGYQSWYFTTNEEYDPIANTWASKTSMWTARSGAFSVISSWIVYVFGWETTWPTRLVTSEAYDILANTWSSKASMTNARSLWWSWLVNWKAYIIWWYNWASWLSFNEEYTLPNYINSWTITTTPNSTKVWVATSSTSLLIQTNF